MVEDRNTMTDSEATPPLYANIVRVAPGPYDVIFDFGYRSPEQLNDAPDEFAPVARIAMSHSHAKSMLPILAKVIASYETAVGEIPVPNYDQLGEEQV